MFKKRPVQKQKTKPEESSIDLTLDWGSAATKINTSEPTDAELNEAMSALREGLAKCTYPYPYAYTDCRREVAMKLKSLLIATGDYTDDQVLVTNGELLIEDCFSKKNNCYIYTIGVAKHPVAFNKLREETGDIQY